MAQVVAGSPFGCGPDNTRQPHIKTLIVHIESIGIIPPMIIAAIPSSVPTNARIRSNENKMSYAWRERAWLRIDSFSHVKSWMYDGPASTPSHG